LSTARLGPATAGLFLACACACSLSSTRAAATENADEPDPHAADEPDPRAADGSAAQKREANLESRATAAFVVGSGLAAIPFAIGATITSSSHEIETNNAGVITMQSGLLVAPLVAHGIVGEWGRGALFTILPALSSAGMITLLATTPSAVTHTTLESQRYFYVLLTGSLLGGTVGVLDALRAPARERAREKERLRARSSSLWFAPLVDTRTLGVGLGGFL
jgi:hypothetical protein